jgi:pilus assembly protein CpaE
MDAALLDSLLTSCGPNLWVVPGTDNPELDEVLDAQTTGVVIDHLRSNFAFAVLDCEHYMSERTIAALDAADSIILVTELSIAALRSTQRSLALCRRLGYDQDKLCVVVNRYHSGELLSVADASALLKHEVFWMLPNDYRTSAGALTKGVPIAVHEQSAKLSQSYRQLAAKLAGPAHQHGKKNGSNGADRRSLRRIFGISKRGR